MTAQAPAISARLITTSEAHKHLSAVIDCHVYECDLFGTHFVQGTLGDNSQVGNVAVCEAHSIDIVRYPTSYGTNEDMKIVRH